MTRAAGVYSVVVAMALMATAPARAAPHPGYRIPPDNPFVATAGARPEVYVYGLRNPYRWSFDRPRGDVYIADVGGNLREEIDYLPRADVAGANLGWNCFEGTRVQTVCRPPNYFPPAWEYPSSADVAIGGYVVHAPDLPSLQGRYLYGQYLTGLYALGPRAVGPAVNVSAGIVGVTSLGEDSAGHLYATSFDGPLYRLGESSGALTVTQIGQFDRPTQVLSPPGDASRLFVVEKRGSVKLLSGGAVSTFLDISHRVRSTGYEEGLVGFVAAPDYGRSGRVFAFYSDNDGDVQIDEYRRTATNPDRSDRSSRRPLITIRHQSTYHHGGQMNFGDDGYLYLSTGDGDPRVDPQNDAQRLDSLRGKILRIDVSARRVDTRAPRLRVSLATEQRVSRARVAVAYAGCNEWCRVSASGRARIGGRVYALLPVAAAPRAGRRGRLELELGARGARALRRALDRRQAVTVRITVRGSDSTGNSARSVRRVRISG